MVRSFSVALALALLAVPARADEQLAIRPLWTVDLATYLETGATLADINNDGDAEALIAGREELIALDGDGTELWRYRNKARYMTCPAVLPRADLPPLLFTADTGGMFTCHDGTGKVVWQAKLKGPSSWSVAAVCDLDADGTFEVVQTDEAGTVWAFDAATGQARWQSKVKGSPSHPSVGDLDGDAGVELAFVTSEGILSALDSDGVPLWEREIGGTSQTWATSSPVIFAASDRTTCIVAASNEGRVLCFLSDGSLLWDRPVHGPVASTVSVGDFDSDGQADIFLITQTGVVYRLDESGAVVWEIDMQGRSLGAGSIIDIQGDGTLEYVLCTQGGHLLILNQAGEFIFDWQFDNRTINITPAFGDLVPDSPGLEMVITGGESGKTFCFATPAPLDTEVQWATYRGNEYKTGAWFGLATSDALRMIPMNLAGNRVIAGQDIRFAVINPDPGDEPLHASAVCIRPDGARQMVTSKVLGKYSELHLPLAVVSPGTYRFEWSLSTSAGEELWRGTRELHLLPFANERGAVERGIRALREAANQVAEVLPLSAAALRREAEDLERERDVLMPLQRAIQGGSATQADAVIERTGALAERAQRALQLAGLVLRAQSLGPKTSLVAYEGELWDNRDVDRQLPSSVASPVKMARHMVPGEHEPVALNVLNILDHPLEVRVLVETPPDGFRVTVHRSVPTVSSLGETSWDPLPELDESCVITIPALASREIWLDMDADGVQPGEHEVVIRLQALNGAGVVDGPKSPQAVPPPETRVELALDVLPFEMVPSRDFRVCAWARYDDPVIQDMLSHGNNVFICPQGTPKYDAQGDLTGFDYASLDKMLAAFEGHDVIALIQGIPGFHGEFGSAEFAADMKVYLEDLTRHLAAHGIDNDHFGLYPIDEPGGHGWDAVNKMVSFGKAVRAADPEIMIYQDGGGELPMFEAMAPYIDIWCVGINMLAEDTPLMRVVRGSGEILWSYDCGYSYARPVGANIKNINLIGQFRTAAHFAFRWGATGMGYWCYNVGEDPWGRIQHEYPLVYPGRTKPVTSRRWEAVRESIEDYRIMVALRARLDAEAKPALPEPVQAQIRDLLDVRLPEMIDKSHNEVILGLGGNVLDTTNTEAGFNEFRDAMMDCVEAVVNAS